MPASSPPRTPLRSPVLVVPLVLVLLAAAATLVALVWNGSLSGGSSSKGSSAGASSDVRGQSAPRLKASGQTLLKKQTALYPRAVRLQHSGSANGRVLISTVTDPGGDARGDVKESSDGGASFHHAGAVASPKGAHGRGLCCATLYELPRRVGNMPAGTLLWAASFGQNEKGRHMSIRVFKSTDHARHWSYLSTVAAAESSGGLWEPEFSIGADGQLICHYSDETDPAHSQKLVAVRTRDGASWSRPRDTVASSLRTDRPGMAVVRRLPTGKYVMTYEICAAQGKYVCVVHYRTSRDGWDWGDPGDLGTRPETADGEYFKHAPTLAWTPERGNPRGKLLLVGQAMYRADGSRAPGSGRTIWTNSKGGDGPWHKVSAPVAVKSEKLDSCPNYSSSLLPSSDGAHVLEVATDMVGGQCKPYVATRPL